MGNKRKAAALILTAILILTGCGAGSGNTEKEAQSAAVEVNSEIKSENTETKTAEAETVSTETAEGSQTQSTETEAAAENSGEDPAEDAVFAEFAQDRLFAEDLPEGDLKKPAGTVSGFEDLVYLLDYMAFYRVGDKIWFLIDEDYAQTFYNPYTEYQKAYETADLADVYACQMDDSYYSEFGVIGIKYSMSRDIASEAPQHITDTPVLASFDYKTFEEGEIALPIESSGLPEISCENGEQLYYLAMNGYCPKPVPGSIAETLYQAAKEALAECTAEGMDDFEKIKAVYDWLTTEVVYDAETAYSAETYLVKAQAYYLEGVYINHCAVCDGKAKACALMLNMLGVPCVRSTGVNEGGDHAWNMVQLDGKWYILCSTYGQSNRTEELGRIVPNYSMLLASAQTPYEWYPAQKHKDIEAQLEENAYDIFAEMGERDGLSLKIGDTEELEALLQQAGSTGKEEYKIEFEYTGDDKETFTEEMVTCLEQFANANASEVRSEKDNVFQIMIMKPQG